MASSNNKAIPEDWRHYREKAEEWKEIDEYPEFKILAPLVREEGSTSVEHTLNEFNALTDSILAEYTAPDAKPHRNGPLSPHPWYTMLSLVELAQRTPHARHRNLVEFIVALMKVEVVDPRTGKKPYLHAVDPDWHRAMWTDLPTFGYTAADAFHGVDPYYLKKTEQCLQWENFVAFLARLSAAAEVNYSDPRSPMSQIELSFWCYTIFSQASKPRPIYPPSDDEDSDENEEEEEDEPAPKQPIGFHQPTECAVRAACMWFIYAADRLWANVKHGRVSDSDDAKVMTKEDWDSWSNIIVSAQEWVAEEETKRLIELALDNVKRVRAE